MTATTDPKPLTERQQDILRAILAHYAAHGTPPTIRDLAEAVGVKGTNGIACHLRAMKKRGPSPCRAIWPAG